MRWGIWGADHSLSEVQGLIETSVDLGLHTFDHADIYGNYTTEKLFGDAFSTMKIERKSIQLISKCGIEMPCENRDFKLKTYNYSKKHILDSVERSLLNLQTDYLDVLLLHRPSPLMERDEIAEAFQELKKKGKVLEFGVSNFTPSQFNLIESVFPLITNQIEISLNKTDAFYDGTLDQLQLKNLCPMAWSVMGNYFSEETEQNARIKSVMKNLCEKYNAEENQLLLSFLLKHPAKILPVVGTSRKETLKNFAKSLEIELEREDWFALLEASKGRRVP